MFCLSSLCLLGSKVFIATIVQEDSRSGSTSIIQVSPWAGYSFRSSWACRRIDRLDALNLRPRECIKFDILVSKYRQLNTVLTVIGDGRKRNRWSKPGE